MGNFTCGKIGRPLLAGMLVLLLAACASNGSAVPGADEHDLSRYRKVMVEPVSVQFDDDWKPVETGSHLEASDAEIDNIREEIAELFMGAVREELTAEGVQLVDEAGPGVLQIKPAVVDVYLSAPLAWGASPADIYTRSIGKLTITAEFRDAATGEVLLKMDDHVRGRDIGLLRPATPRITATELARIFRDWAQTVGTRFLGTT